MNLEKYLAVIATVLSIGSAVGPCVFGYIFFRMSKIFVTREQFDEYKMDRKEAFEKFDEHICERLGTIETDIKQLILRKD